MRVRQILAVALIGAGVLGGTAVQAQDVAALKEADLDLGQQLIAEHKCNECHAQKWANDGLAIYRPKGRVDSTAKLLSMVEACNTELGLSLFPEDVAAVAAVLNRDHYHFKD